MDHPPHKANKTPLPPRLKGKLRVLGGVPTPLKRALSRALLNLHIDHIIVFFLRRLCASLLVLLAFSFLSVLSKSLNAFWIFSTSLGSRFALCSSRFFNANLVVLH